MMRTKTIILSCFILVGIHVFSIDNDSIEKTLLTVTTEPGAIVAEKVIEELNITELLLSNGMKVCLKPTNSYDDEILLNLFALGGWLSFPVEQRASAKYAGTIALASGLGTIDAANLTKFMFKYSVEFSVRTRLDQRSLEASCPVNSTEYLLAIIREYFSHPRYEEQGLAIVMQNTRDAVHHRSRDCDAYFEDLFNALNSQEHPALKPTTESELDNVNVKDSQNIFQQSFSSPEEFTCVIVGRFDVETLKPLILRHLASIPPKPQSPIWQQETIPMPFPKGIVTHEGSCHHNNEGLTRLTFPITLEITPSSFHELEFATQIIETLLRNHLRDTMGTTQAVDVGYVFPLYPRLHPVWLTLQFRSSPKLVKPILNTILKEMKKLWENGPKHKDVEAVNVLFERINTFWNQENSYWLATLSNYYRWQWDPATLNAAQKRLESLSLQELHQILKKTFTIDNYTVVTMYE